MNLLPYLGVGFSIITTIFNIAIILAIKMNDLKHLQKDLDEIKTSIKELFVKTDEVAERISTIEGKCSANHPL